MDNSSREFTKAEALRDLANYQRAHLCRYIKNWR